jgi:hypothetical protein
MRKGIQNMMEAAGKWGCCALCLIELAERQTHKAIDPTIAFDYAIGKGWIKYNWDDPNCKDNYFVARPEDFFNYLTGKRWKYHHEGADYPLKEGELEIDVYKLGKAMHFCLPDWDSLVTSKTKREGKLDGKRVLTPVRG